MQWLQRWWVKAISGYFLWRIWLFLVMFAAFLWIPIRPGYLAAFEFSEGLPLALTVWGNFDGLVFMRIAHGGYGLPEVPFFPLLPLLMQSLHMLGIPFVLGGMLIAFVSVIGTIFVWRRLWHLDTRDKQYQNVTFGWLLLCLFLFPTAHYFTAVYQDALFLFLASSTILAARMKKWGWASVFGAIATLSRLNGLALFFVLGAEYLIQLQPRLAAGRWYNTLPLRAFLSGIHPKNIIKNQYVWLFLSIPIAFIAYLYFLEMKFGDWQVFFSSVEVWHRSQITFPLQTFWRYFKILVVHANLNFVYWVAFGEAAFTALYLFVLLFSWGRIRFSYWIFMCVHLLIPMLTGTLQGMPRYGLHLYPLFLSLAAWTSGKEKKWLRYGCVCIMMFLQAIYLAAFVRGYFVA